MLEWMNARIKLNYTAKESGWTKMKFCIGEQQDNTRKLVRIQCTDVIFNTFYRKFIKKIQEYCEKIEELFSEEGRNFPEWEPSRGGIINRQLEANSCTLEKWSLVTNVTTGEYKVTLMSMNSAWTRTHCDKLFFASRYVENLCAN